MRLLGWALIQSDTRGACRRAGKRPCEDTWRRWSSARQGKQPRENPDLLTPQSCTSGLQNCENIIVCCLSHAARGSPSKRMRSPSEGHPCHKCGFLYFFPEPTCRPRWLFAPRTECYLKKRARERVNSWCGKNTQQTAWRRSAIQNLKSQSGRARRCVET